MLQKVGNGHTSQHKQAHSALPTITSMELAFDTAFWIPGTHLHENLATHLHHRQMALQNLPVTVHTTSPRHWEKSNLPRIHKKRQSIYWSQAETLAETKAAQENHMVEYPYSWWRHAPSAQKHNSDYNWCIPYLPWVHNQYIPSNLGTVGNWVLSARHVLKAYSEQKREARFFVCNKIKYFKKL